MSSVEKFSVILHDIVCLFQSTIRGFTVISMLIINYEGAGVCNVRINGPCIICHILLL